MKYTNKEQKRKKAQLTVTLVVLSLIIIIIAIWLLVSKLTASDTSKGDSAIGETILAGGRENGEEEQNGSSKSDAENGQSSNHAANDDTGSDNDPLKQNTVLPDDGAGAETGLEDAAASRQTDITLGIDVSKWQGKIDWEEVAAAGVDFAIIRVGYRTTDTGEICADPYAAYNLQNASAAGIQVGAYFFSTAISQEEAVEEASWTADFLAGYPVTYPIAYNCEGFLSSDSRMYGISAEERTRYALAFLQAIEDAGYEAVFHASKYDLTDGESWDTPQIEDRYPVWVAQYPSVPYPKTELPSYSGSYAMWQYTSQGNVPGISAYVDLNVAYFKYDETASPKNPGAAVDAGDVPIDSTFTEVSELVTAKDETNLRTEPSTVSDDTITASIRNGEWVERIGVSTRGWSQIRYNGQILYARTSLLLTEEEAETYSAPEPAQTVSSIYTAVNDTVTAKVETNLRNSASTEGTEVVATIQNGEWVERTGIGSNGWSRLIYNGQTVYALTSYLTTDAGYDPEDVDSRDIVWTAVSVTMTAKEKTNLRDKPSTESDSQVLATIYYGDAVTCTALGSNGWSRVEYDGQTLYAVSSLLTEYSGE